ncbi:helix-turn-helix transcriptional regulator [Microbacterium sp. 4R-513]|uniref:ArsR/SmtB family transcription factor n=1 Tax=Microbacterium sp. 4R-513 TaxID=2567934 RepID=UPI0013E1BCE7|nr:helix-turn-helix domain-containing protein [Microbacterium sp. 4R-513]QIG39457.1 helix-turn-helix transcriptional regulator [Microbacterium sp. 4R-513]
MTAMTRQLEADSGLERCFSAVAFGERRALLERLLDDHLDAGDGMTITALAQATGTTRFTASRHLAVLRAAGLVRAELRGTRRVHRLDLDAIAAIDDWLQPFIAASWAADVA